MTPTRLALCALLSAAPALAEGAQATRATTEFIEVEENPGSAPSYLTVANGCLYFATDDGLHGNELWLVDAAGAVGLDCDFNEGPASSTPRAFAEFENSLYYLVDYTTERGVTSSMCVRKAGPGQCATELQYTNTAQALLREPSFCVNAGDTLFLDSRSSEHGRELWGLEASNGYASLVRDTMPGLEDGLSTSPEDAWTLGNRLLFEAQCAYDPVPGSYRLWVSDGTREGTFSLLPEPPIPAGMDHGEPHNVMVIGRKAYFSGARDHLWVTDGTRKGTRDIKDLIVPKEFCECEGVVYFQADDGEHGPELWRTDGTPEGTWMVKDINPGPPPSGPFFLRSLDEYFLFNADDGVHGYELWRSDGTAEGTKLVRDIYEGPTSSNLYQPTVFEGLLLFAADHPVYGEELWRSDGTQEGTVLVKDIREGPDNSEPYYLTVFDGCVYFSANDGVHGEELWRSDGTQAGTALAADVNPRRRMVGSSNPANLCCVGDILYFVADDVSHGAELWQSHLRTGDTDLVMDINAGPAHADPQELTAVGSLVFFTADDGVNGRELWRSDGTEQGTEHISAWPLDAGIVSLQCLTAIGESLCFTATDAEGEVHMCSLAWPNRQPSLAHTLEGSLRAGKVRRISALHSAVNVCIECVDGRYRFLVAQSPEGPFRLSQTTLPIPPTWENVRRMALSDEEGMSEEWLHNYLSTPEMAGTRSVWWNDMVYFAAYVPDTGVELWRSRNGAREAELVRDLLPGPASGSPCELTVYGDELYFAAEHGTNGRELWRSDGTPIGTVCFQDFAPGKSGSNPTELTLLADTLVLTVRRPGILDGAEFLAYLSSDDTSQPLTGQTRYGIVWPVNPQELTVGGKHIYFRGTGLGSGTELWRATATPGSPVLVRNIIDDTAYDSCRELHRVR